MTVEFPRRYIPQLQELAARTFDSRKAGSDHEALARTLLAGIEDICMRSGLDGVLVALELADGAALVDDPRFVPALVARLGTLDLDAGGPQNAKLQHLVDAIVAALGLTLVDEADRTIAFGDDVRVAVLAALASVIDPELGVPQLRETIIAAARARCDPAHLAAFGRTAAQLDERGMRLLKQPKVPLHVQHAIEHVLSETRAATIDRIVRAAIDRAVPVIAAVDADAAARIDRKITHRLTPRDVASLRIADPRVPKAPAAVLKVLFESLVDTARFAWRAPERPVRTYAATATFAIGDVVEHPKFGRGSVIACKAQRVDIEFADATRTLVHLAAK